MPTSTYNHPRTDTSTSEQAIVREQHAQLLDNSNQAQSRHTTPFIYPLPLLIWRTSGLSERGHTTYRLAGAQCKPASSGQAIRLHLPWLFNKVIARLVASEHCVT